MKKGVKITLAVLLSCAIAGGAGLGVLYKSQNPKALKFKKWVKYALLNSQIPRLENETVGFDTIDKVELYENNALVAREKLNYLKDNKKVYISGDTKRLIDYPKGYMIDMSSEVEFDFAYSPLYTKVNCGEAFEAVISREYSPYDDIDWYIDYYLHRFLISKEYQQANGVTVKSDESKTVGTHSMRIIDAKIENLDNGKYDGYVYVTIKTNGRFFYRIMYRYRSSDVDFVTNTVMPHLESFDYFEGHGTGYYDLDFKPIIPETWSEETKELYNKLANGDKMRWGIFAKDIYEEGINKTIPELEKKVEYKFPIILAYKHFKHEFPTEFMQQCYDEGRIVELTYQVTESNNENLEGYTPNIDMYRGVKDEDIREFARAAKEFGHPFLFRLNNEMNSDWVSYGGVTNMSDPEIFIDNWKRFYRIFEEEGAHNVIWIFNPNDRNHPPCDWNNFLAYYPGNEYVQLIGVTGYNNGTYFKEERAEEWREFKEIYDAVNDAYMPFFSEFPWIITEFSSSSIGGDKAKWIDNMFNNMDKYKNIKAAVWFDYADYDFREGKTHIVSRPYWLDETPETTEAFRKGVKKNSTSEW